MACGSFFKVFIEDFILKNTQWVTSFNAGFNESSDRE